MARIDRTSTVSYLHSILSVYLYKSMQIKHISLTLEHLCSAPFNSLVSARIMGLQHHQPNAPPMPYDITHQAEKVYRLLDYKDQYAY